MSDKAGMYREYKQHFILDEAMLRKINDVLRSHASRLKDLTFIRLHVKREDDSFYETTDIAEVLADSNTPSKAIKLLALEVHREADRADAKSLPDIDRKKALAIVVFDRFGKDDKVSFVVQEKERDWCFLLADELDAQIKRLIQKGVLPLSFPPYLIDPIVFFTGGAIALLYLAYLGTKLSPPFSPEQIQAMTQEDRVTRILELVSKKQSKSDWIMPITWVVMAVVFVFLGLRPISRLVEKMSRSVFYWGDMAKIHDAYRARMVQIKWGVAVAFVVSLIASIVAAVMMK